MPDPVSLSDSGDLHERQLTAVASSAKTGTVLAPWVPNVGTFWEAVAFPGRLTLGPRGGPRP